MSSQNYNFTTRKESSYFQIPLDDFNDKACRWKEENIPEVQTVNEKSVLLEQTRISRGKGKKLELHVIFNVSECYCFD
jgi:hypothetical protein